eukprot:1100909-Prymnesium_polylepis.2
MMNTAMTPDAIRMRPTCVGKCGVLDSLSVTAAAPHVMDGVVFAAGAAMSRSCQWSAECGKCGLSHKRKTCTFSQPYSRWTCSGIVVCIEQLAIAQSSAAAPMRVTTDHAVSFGEPSDRLSVRPSVDSARAASPPSSPASSPAASSCEAVDERDERRRDDDSGGEMNSDGGSRKT